MNRSALRVSLSPILGPGSWVLGPEYGYKSGPSLYVSIRITLILAITLISWMVSFYCCTQPGQATCLVGIQPVVWICSNGQFRVYQVLKYKILHCTPKRDHEMRQSPCYICHMTGSNTLNLFIDVLMEILWCGCSRPIVGDISVLLLLQITGLRCSTVQSTYKYAKTSFTNVDKLKVLSAPHNWVQRLRPIVRWYNQH